MLPEAKSQQAQLGANERDGGDGGGLGAEHARAEVGEGEVLRAKQIALGRRPAALGSEGEHDGSVTYYVTLAQGGGGFVVVEGEARGGGREGGEEVGEGAAVRDGGEAGVESLLGAGDKVPAPFAGGPERAARVVGIAFFGGDEVQRGDAERGGVAKDVARGLRAGEAEEERDGRGRRRRRGIPREGEGERGGVEGDESGFAARAVDEAAVEGVAETAAEDAENVQRARVGAREREGGFGRLEEDEVHAARSEMADSAGGVAQ